MVCQMAVMSGWIVMVISNIMTSSTGNNNDNLN